MNTSPRSNSPILRYFPIVWNEESSIHRFSPSSSPQKKERSRFLRFFQIDSSLLSFPSKTRSARFLISFQLENHESHGRSKVPSDGETLRLFNLSSAFPFIPYPPPPSLSSPLHAAPFCFHFPPPLFSSSFVHLLSFPVRNAPIRRVRSTC